MKAKIINEDAHFQRGEDPRKSIGIGNKRFDDWEDYLADIAERKGMDKDRLMGYIEQNYQDSEPWDILEMAFDILRRTPIEFQIQFIDEEIDSLEGLWDSLDEFK